MSMFLLDTDTITSAQYGTEWEDQIMNALRIRRMLDSETLHLPELRPLLGKQVEIIVLEDPSPTNTHGTGDWDDAIKAVEELEDYDFDAYRKQREVDIQHAKDHLP